MKKYDKQPWSDSERHVLRDYYYVLGMEHLLEILPGRTPNSIRKQVAYLKKRGWYFKKEKNESFTAFYKGYTNSLHSCR